MSLDRSDQFRTWVPMHVGTKNKVKLRHPSRFTPRRVERLNGVPVNPLTGEVDVETALLSGCSAEAILTALQEDS